MLQQRHLLARNHQHGFAFSHGPCRCRHLNGYPDRPPVRPNISLGDSLAGLHAAFGAVMALHAQRRLNGAGQVGFRTCLQRCGHDERTRTSLLSRNVQGLMRQSIHCAA